MIEIRRIEPDYRMMRQTSLRLVEDACRLLVAGPKTREERLTIKRQLSAAWRRARSANCQDNLIAHAAKLGVTLVEDEP